MKKLFTTFLMMTVALFSWGQDATGEWPTWSGGTYNWDEGNGTLTVKYTGGDFDLNDFEGPQKEWHHKIQNLVLDGPFTNSQWKDKLDKFVNDCAEHGPGQTKAVVPVSFLKFKPLLITSVQVTVILIRLKLIL